MHGHPPSIFYSNFASIKIFYYFSITQNTSFAEIRQKNDCLKIWKFNKFLPPLFFIFFGNHCVEAFVYAIATRKVQNKQLKDFMKYLLFIHTFFISFAVSAQHLPFQHTRLYTGLIREENLATEKEFSYTSEKQVTGPVAPVMTTRPENLEICIGENTTLTASSNRTIYWFNNPPPLGSPLATGNSFTTPNLDEGYYFYYAFTEEAGVWSQVSAFDIVLVYPLPTVTLESTHHLICAGEKATLSANGTSYFNWADGRTTKEIEIEPQVNTTYTVTGISLTGCRNTAVYTQRVESCTGIDYSPFGDHHSAVYPNPNKGEFNVFVHSISETTKIEVYSSLGQLVHTSKVSTETSQVDLTSIPNGIYIVRICEHDKVLKQEKIVKE
jgi:hypothetical protein